MSAPQSEFIVVYQDFAKGEYGRLVPTEHGRTGTEGLWTGTNIVPAFDGSLIPCPQPQAKTATGLPDVPYALGIGTDGTQRMLWVQIPAGTIYRAASNYAFSNIGTIAFVGGIGVIDSVAYGTASYAVCGGGVYKIELSGAGAVTLLHADTIAAADVGTICVAGDRLLYSKGNRVFFSAAGDFTSWPAANYFDVGVANVAISSMVNMRSAIAIGKGTGNDTAWWILSGVPGVNHVLRRSAELPAGVHAATSLRDGKVGFVAGNQAGTGLAVYPAVFNGSAVAGARHLGNLIAGTSRPVQLFQVGDWLAYDGGGHRGLLFRNGSWSYHLFPSAVTSVKPASDPASDAVIWPSTASTFYEWAAYLDRPAFTSDTTGAAPTAASFTLPEWVTAIARYSPGPTERVGVRAVIVDFRKWNTGDTANPNTFTVSVASKHRYDGNADRTDAGAVWSEAAAISSTSGTDARQIIKFKPDFGSGFQLTLSGLRGVAIKQISVLVHLNAEQNQS